MKVFSVIGFSKSGKTTTIEALVRVLRNRGYSVGTVKEIHFEGFRMDTDGTNTSRHKDAGAQLVTARGLHETSVLFQEKLNIEKILGFYDHDFVILEGVRDIGVPKILTAHDAEEVERGLNDTIFAISGRFAENNQHYKNLPVINALTDAEKLADLIEEKVSDHTTLTVKIDGKEIEMVPFVQKVFQNLIEGFLKELQGFQPDGDIEICIKK